MAGRERALKKVLEALQFQLSERLKFIKSADPVVASLLFDYATIEAGTGTLESARGLLKMAADYGYPADRINPLLDQYAGIIRVAKLKTWFFIVAGILAFIAFLIYAIKRGWMTYRRFATSHRETGVTPQAFYITESTDKQIASRGTCYLEFRPSFFRHLSFS